MSTEIQPKIALRTPLHGEYDKALKTIASLAKENDALKAKLDCETKHNEILYRANKEALSEVEQLNKALKIKLDAMPSGLSAGQSMKMEAELNDLRQKLDAAERAGEAQISMLRAFRHSMDTDKPFPSMEKLTAIINGSDFGQGFVRREEFKAHLESAIGYLEMIESMGDERYGTTKSIHDAVNRALDELQTLRGGT